MLLIMNLRDLELHIGLGGGALEHPRSPSRKDRDVLCAVPQVDVVAVRNAIELSQVLQVAELRNDHLFPSSFRIC